MSWRQRDRELPPPGVSERGPFPAELSPDAQGASSPLPAHGQPDHGRRALPRRCRTCHRGLWNQSQAKGMYTGIARRAAQAQGREWRTVRRRQLSAPNAHPRSAAPSPASLRVHKWERLRPTRFRRALHNQGRWGTATPSGAPPNANQRACTAKGLPDSESAANVAKPARALERPSRGVGARRRAGRRALRRHGPLPHRPKTGARDA